MMPDMDGWEVLQILRNTPATTHIPAVICSLFRNPELAASLGATVYLVKPIRRDDLLGALHQVGVL
jgi:CheY-like chemotaxis protein